MLQRVKHNQMLRNANRLLELRDSVRKQLGDQYADHTAPFTPFVAIEYQHCGCPQLAATRVLRKLDSQLQNDLAVKRLVMCAALDVAVEKVSLPLAG